MKPFFRYHGGKQRMATKILDLIPSHRIYCEPFCGGASLLFAKPRPILTNQDDYSEIINDTNNLLITFYEQAKTNTEELYKLVDSRLYSEEWYRLSGDIIRNHFNYTPLEIAWAYWYSLNCSFGGKCCGGFGYGKRRTRAHHVTIAINAFKTHCERLKPVLIHSRDALDVIKYYDSEETFFYIDPPYVDTNQGHYKGYTVDNYLELLDVLKQLKGKFLLSGYDNPYVPSEWDYLTHDTNCTMAKNVGTKRQPRTEYLWFNYELPTENHRFNVSGRRKASDRTFDHQLLIPGLNG